MCASLREQCIGLGLKGLHCISAGSKARWRIVQRGQSHESLGKLDRIATLLAVHAGPGRYSLLGALLIVSDGGLSVDGRVLCKKLGAEESGLNQHRADAEWRDF